MTPTFDNGSYTDLNRLSELKVGENRESDANIRKVAQEFESVFMGQMLKSMRAASDVMADKNNPFNSQASLQYRDMHDQQLAVSLSREGGGMGLSDVLVRQLSQRRGKLVSGAPSANATAASTTGTNSLGQNNVAARDDSRLLAMRRLSVPSRAAILRHAQMQAQQTTGSTAAATGDTLAARARSSNALSATSRVASTEKTFTGQQWAAALRGLNRAAEKSQTTTATNAAETTAGYADSVFQSREDFISTMLPMAEKAAQQLGVDPHFLVAQAALETGWGKSMIRTADGGNSHNLFGIKSTAWTGASAQVATTEYVNGKPTREVAGFRVYNSFEQSFNDYADLLQGSGRYQAALKVAESSGSSERFMQELQKAGYATDPDYASKVTQVARKVQQTYQNTAAAGATPAMRTRG